MNVWLAGLAWLLVLALAGCGTLPQGPLHSAWYLQYQAPASLPEGAQQRTLRPEGRYQLYVALLNRGSRDMYTQDITLNRRAEAPAAAWRWDPIHSNDERVRRLTRRPTLEPGRLLTLPASGFVRQEGEQWISFDQACLLPVEVAVVLARDSRPRFEQWISQIQGDPEGMIRAELVGRMPSSLPEDWDEACRPPQASGEPPRTTTPR